MRGQNWTPVKFSENCKFRCCFNWLWLSWGGVKVRRRFTAPPHTRGWTPLAVRSRLSARGSPAHAGMDPSARTTQPTQRRLPRTRGDGPDPAMTIVVSGMAPPHTRGWTPIFLVFPAIFGGSPAHAGMDPLSMRCRVGNKGLPRTRGDGPALIPPICRIYWAPPHTRGWTRPAGIREVAYRGSPAHAGMDLIWALTVLMAIGLPRTRGDGPRVIHRTSRPVKAPPHTRGWTLDRGLEQERRYGSPAHAGASARAAARFLAVSNALASCCSST